LARQPVPPPLPEFFAERKKRARYRLPLFALSADSVYFGWACTPLRAKRSLSYMPALFSSSCK